MDDIGLLTEFRYGDADGTYGESMRLTSALSRIGGLSAFDSAALPGRSFSYEHDLAGNRRVRQVDGGDAERYERNGFNQLADGRHAGKIRVSGLAPATVSGSAVTIRALGSGERRPWGDPAAQRAGPYFYREIPYDNGSSAVYEPDLAVLASWGESDGSGASGWLEKRRAYVPAAYVQCEYDADGNLTDDGRWEYEWDALNRLRSMRTSVRAGLAGRPFVRGLSSATSSRIAVWRNGSIGGIWPWPERPAISTKDFG